MPKKIKSANALLSPWAPLRHPLFRAMWIANTVSYIGSWMHDVGAAWMMASLAPSPVMIALVQTATTLPLFMFSLFSGALADMTDRKKIILFAQTWMTVASLSLGILTLNHQVTPMILLVFTFLLNTGLAMNGPSWQGMIPEVVPIKDLAGAITLASAGFNMARALGPAAGGFLIAHAGTWSVFFLNALSFLGVILVVSLMKNEKKPTFVSHHKIKDAIISGLQYCKKSEVSRAILIRLSLFVFFGSSLWALLPALAKIELQLTSVHYGMLMGFFGMGAVTTAFLLPMIRSLSSTDGACRLATLLAFITLAQLAWLKHFPSLCVLMIFGGGAWVSILSTLNSAVQLSASNEFRSRILSIYTLVFCGSLTIGSTVWGYTAKAFGIRSTFACGAAGLLVSLLFTSRIPLDNVHQDLRPEPAL